MPTGKKELLASFQKDWKKYWDLPILKENGFKRQNCKSCGKWFWAVVDQDKCNDSSCRPYEFLGKPFIPKKYSYFSAWDAIKKFFVKEGHVPLERYPVLCRWYPLYFNIAGIVNFYRMSGNKLTFEFPANPSIVLQPCLRFNNIPNIGVTGRADTSFCMVQQSALWDGKQGYWKDHAIGLDYRMLTEVFRIKPEAINFLEDAWLGHGAFGSSLEYHIAGVELGNCVFTEFAGSPDNYTVMQQKVIDMGAGLERFVWASAGTPTIYDAVYGEVIDKMKTKAGIKYDKELFLRYSKLAGRLNFDECPDLEATREDIAHILGIDKSELVQKIDPMTALYSIADHSKTLALAIADGGLPSNIGGGYNLRVILRRALSFIRKYNIPFDLYWSTEKMAEFLKPMFPELREALPEIHEIIGVEEKRYQNATERTRRVIDTLLDKHEKMTENKLAELYDSQGITPELIAQVAAEKDIKIELPAGFWANVADLHTIERGEKKVSDIDVSGLPETELLYYEDMEKREFSASVLKIIGERFVVLDKTLFYPRGGGQEPDFGTLNGKKDFDSEKINGVIVHSVENPNFKVGDIVKGRIDWERRWQITLHHDATHVINAAARKVLGPWVWQEGSKKDTERAHLDIDHYQPLSKENVEKIENLANKVAERGLTVDKKVWDRTKAEKKFGFKIYQGAAVPSDKLRIVQIGDFSVEACGGTHGNNTKDLFPILITKSERPADGTVRLVYKAGPAAIKHLEGVEKEIKELSAILDVPEGKIPKAVEKLFVDWKNHLKIKEREMETTAKEKAAQLKFEGGKGLRFLVKALEGADAQKISKELSGDDTVIFLICGNEKLSVFASAGKKAVSQGINVGKLLKEACEQLGGRGGGRPELAQGVGQNNEKIEEVLEWVKKRLME